MRKPKDPRELAEAILSRSTCKVQVGAVLADRHGTFAWGWNGVGPDGAGIHAEAHCLSRADLNRALGLYATMYIAAYRKGKRIVSAKPCDVCQGRLLWADVQKVMYRDSAGVWRRWR